MSPRHIPIVDRVRDAFFALDTDFRFTYVNERAESLLSRSREDLLGRVMWDEFPETVETQFPDGFYQAMDEQVPVSFEVYHSPLETWFETRAWPDESGLSVYMRDVTERKERETKLARNTAVVEAVQDGIVTLDDNTRILSVNTTLEETFDVDAGELRGEHVETLLDIASIDAEDAVRVGRAISDVGVGTGSFRSVEVPYTNAAGDSGVVDIRVVPIDHGSANVACIARDITDQREYERVVTSLHEVTRWLLQSDEPEEICAIAVHAGSDLLNLPISGVWLLDDEYGYLDPVAGTAGAHEEFGGLPRFRPGEGLVWDVFESGDLEYFEDLHSVEGVYNPDTPIHSEIIAPIGTHGIMMTGAKRPDQFSETDIDLISMLVENTRAALDRAIREQVLRERSDALERQTNRLEAVANVLSSDLKDQLEAVATALEEEQRTEATEWEFPLAEDTVTTTLDRTERLVDDVQEFARNATAVGPRTRIDLEEAIDAALADSRLERPSIVVDADATLRADHERFHNLLETVFNDVAARADGLVTIQVGLIGFSTPRTETRGFFLMDDAAEVPPTENENLADREQRSPSTVGFISPPTNELALEEPDAAVTVEDETAESAEATEIETEGTPALRPDDRSERGLGLTLARAIAEAHDWELLVKRGQHGGTRIEIRDVTTLEQH
ncbi:PAS domain-containing protein [Natronosalvus amylolyticus]|uniref:PAS domain-containing protein n=1 Tax=Natronosalvus amylolyticus TaxID=2961994 RepID=UPI0020C9826F|nr:PAS domain-containing protein [Natronosalvus amylolyticus]